jgi:protoporphyrinogen oxidase
MKSMAPEVAVIIGAGPAGLTAAYELVTRTHIKPIILEKSNFMGGLARTVNYKGNRIDIGGHRFFSKSDRVMDWWLARMPMEMVNGKEQQIAYQKAFRLVAANEKGPDPEQVDEVMLLRKRKSRLYFKRKFFDYPISLKLDTLCKLGFVSTMKIGFSYLKALLLPIKPEENLEQFFINRFGKELYLTFFKSYTEKVWGTPCEKIDAAWGAQRIKGLSITKALLHATKKILGQSQDVRQKKTETSLIEQFLYPKYGPGQLWEIVAEEVKSKGAELYTDIEVTGLVVDGDRVKAVETINRQTSEKKTFQADYVFSSMPVKELIRALSCEVPHEVKEISEGLVYRDFITVGLLVKELKIKNDDERAQKLITDNWIYIRMCASDACRSLTIGAHIWLATRIKYGWAWNTFAMKPTTYGVGLTKRCRLWALTNWTRLELLINLRCSIRQS